MKNDHGRGAGSFIGGILFFWLFFTLGAIADEGFTYKVSISQKELYLKEPFILTVDVEQTDASIVMFFDLLMPKDGRFFIKRLDKQIDDAYHHKKVRFIYLLFPLQPGRYPASFDLLIRRTNDATIAQSTTGGRYNFKDVQTWDEKVSITTDPLNVRAIATDAVLVGDFKLTQTIDKTQLYALHPAYLTIRLKGVGFPPPKKPFSLKIDGVKLFADKPIVHERFTKKGVVYDGTYTYALVADHDFTLPSLALQAFSYTKGQAYTLKTPPLHLHIVPIPKRQLIEKQSRPESIEDRFNRWIGWLIEGLIFLSGYLTAFLVQRVRTLWQGQISMFGIDPFAKEVKRAKTPKALLTLLLQNDPMRYASQIACLEKAIYANEKIDLGRVKKEILDG